MRRPSLFVGSSSEGLEVAQKIRQQLRDVAEVTIWHEGPFGLNRGTLENLLTALETFDFAVLVLTPDDLVESRGGVSPSARDNVVFECGLFLGRLGRERTFLVYDSSRELKLPSDLAGVAIAKFHGDRQDHNLLAAVGEATDPIRDAVRQHGVRVLAHSPDLAAPRLRASLSLTGKGEPISHRIEGVLHYEVRLFLENTPDDTEFVTYTILNDDDTWPEAEREARVLWGVRDFEQYIETYGDLDITVNLTSKSGSSRAKAILSEALAHTHGASASENVRNALTRLRQR